METSAAIHVRRTAMDDREGDNRSLGAQERECREWAAEARVPAAKGEVGPKLRLVVETVRRLAMLDSAGTTLDSWKTLQDLIPRLDAGLENRR